MNYDALKFWLEVVIVLGTAANILYTWAANRHRANKAEIEAANKEFAQIMSRMDERAVALNLRVTKIEAELNHIPTTHALNNLALQFESLHGDFKKIGAELQGVRELQDVMRDHARLMDQFLRANK